MNIIAKIEQIEYALKSGGEGSRENLPALGIQVNNEEVELIKEYLTKSAIKIMIIGKE